MEQKDKKLSFRRKHPVLKHPVIGSLVSYLTGMLVVIIVSALFAAASQVVQGIALIAASFLVLFLFRLWFREEYSGSFHTGTLACKDVNIVVLIVFAAALGLAVIPGWIRYGVEGFSFAVAVQGTSAGVSEEVLYRVLMCAVIMRAGTDRKHILLTVIFVSVFFGLTHLGNAAMGSGLLYSIFQAVSSACGGLFFAAVYLRSGNIAVPMIFHSVYDILAMMQKNQETTGAMEIVLSLFYSIVLAAAAYYLIHNHEQEIAELWNKIWHKNEEKPA